MQRVTKIRVGDQERPARELAFKPVNEEWSEYKLTDGGSFRLRVTVLRVYRVLEDDGKPAYQPDGQPFLVVTSQPQLIADE